MGAYGFINAEPGRDADRPATHNGGVESRWSVLGVDGGGTRSEARLWSGREVVARASGAALNPNHVGPARSREHLIALLDGFRIDSSVRSPDAACLGLSGVSHPASRSIVREALETAGFAVAGPRLLVGDGDLVLEAAFGAAAPSGVALICGTGSIALARAPDGALVRAGGRGPERGDEGGGGWIGREALAAGLVALPDGSPAAPASLVPAVLAAARDGAPGAVGLLRRAARALASIAREAAAGARLEAPFEVRASGGVAVHAPELVAFLAQELGLGTPTGRLGPLVVEPVAGALGLATRALERGGSVPPGW
jgi:N-acetylglucosamine kinase-like BadF-type ATPase